MTSLFLPVYVILNQMSTHPVQNVQKVFHHFMLLWFGQEMWAGGHWILRFFVDILILRAAVPIRHFSTALVFQ